MNQLPKLRVNEPASQTQIDDAIEKSTPARTLCFVTWYSS